MSKNKLGSAGFPSYFTYLKDPKIIWFNPCWGYHGFWKRLSEFQEEKNIDFQKAWSHRAMKRNKEIYAMALTALCLQHNLPTEYGWWFTKPIQDPPDGLVATPLKDAAMNGNIMHGREVEVVEYLGGSLFDTIQKKLDKKAYEPNTILVCLLSPQNFEILDFKSLAKKIQKTKLPLSHIFVAGNGFSTSVTQFEALTYEEKLKKMLDILLIQLLPKYVTVSISPDDYCKAFFEGKQSAWLKFQSIGKGVGFHEVKVEHPPKLFD